MAFCENATTIHIPTETCDDCTAYEQRISDLETALESANSAISDIQGSISSMDTAIDGKQDALTAGDNITIENNVISADTNDADKIVFYLSSGDITADNITTGTSATAAEIIENISNHAAGSLLFYDGDMYYPASAYSATNGGYSIYFDAVVFTSSGQSIAQHRVSGDVNSINYSSYTLSDINVSVSDSGGNVYSYDFLGESNGTVTYQTRTVLYTDGTLIINELGADRESNIASHGAALNEYVPFDTSNDYVFASASARPWNSEAYSIKSIDIGSVIHPTSMAYWFKNCRATEIDLTNIRTESVTDMQSLFSECTRLTSITWPSTFDTSKVTNMENMFESIGLTSLTFPNGFDTSSVTNMYYMFATTNLTSLVLPGGFDTGNVTNMAGMFIGNESLLTLTLSNAFDTSSVTDFGDMFFECNQMTTIYAYDSFTVASGATTSAMFESLLRIVGGNGTTYDSTHDSDGAYARIDIAGAPGYFTQIT